MLIGKKREKYRETQRRKRKIPHNPSVLRYDNILVDTLPVFFSLLIQQIFTEFFDTYVYISQFLHNWDHIVHPFFLVREHLKHAAMLLLLYILHL